MSRSKGKKFKHDRQQTPQAPKHQSASQSASPNSPRSQKRKKAKAAAAASAKAVKEPTPKAPPPPPKIPSYKIQLQELEEPIDDLATYYRIYSFGQLWEDMTGQSILKRSNIKSHFMFTPEGAHALAYLLDVLEHKKGWDDKSISRLAKFPGGIAGTSLQSLRNRKYSTKAYMGRSSVDSSKLSWLVEYANHLSTNPPPKTGTHFIEGAVSANTGANLSSEVAEMKKILYLSGRSPNEKKTGTLALILVQKYGITPGILDQLSDRNPSNERHRILREDIAFFRLARAMAERRRKKKMEYGIEKLSIARNIAICLVNGWTKYQSWLFRRHARASTACSYGS